MSHSVHHPWLHRFAVLTALATLALLGIGGLVTSHGVGMAVPDWPTTYGYNMFLFPVSKWVGGIFYEHSHRLVASGVGLLTTILAGWLWFAEPRRWLRWLGVVAFFAVVIQGVLGGLRVVLFKDEIGIFHATLAQLFFVLVCAIALFTSEWWALNLQWVGSVGASARRGQLFLPATLLIFLQLVLGATMRHQHAGLAIPDFPLAYGKLWPAMDAVSVAGYSQHRVEVTATNPITAAQIALQMAHRILALTIFAAVAWLAGATRSRLGAGSPVARLTTAWFGIILLQVILGAATVWTGKAADIATFHVAVGAKSLVAGSLLSLLVTRANRDSAGKVDCVVEKPTPARLEALRA